MHDSPLTGVFSYGLFGAEKPPSGRFFHLWHKGFLSKENAMKTIVYVDGYNLYYGCLKNTKDKWLDLIHLFGNILKVQNPSSELFKLKFFTADVKTKLSSHGVDAQKAQDSYQRAHQYLYPQQFEVIKGFHSLEPNRALVYQQPPNRNNRVEIWRLEEKQTDVNIALEVYRDVAKGNAEQVVIISNDSDQAPVVDAIKMDFPDIKFGIVLPIRQKSKRTISQQLSKNADWTRHYILDEEFSTSQLPIKIATNRKPIIKPDYW